MKVFPIFAISGAAGLLGFAVWLLFMKADRTPQAGIVVSAQTRQPPNLPIQESVSIKRGKHLKWPSSSDEEAWASTGTMSGYAKARIAWVLKEIFQGMELPASARDFGQNGFRMDVADAAKFVEDLKKATKYTDKYGVWPNYDTVLYREVSFIKINQEMPDSRIQGLKSGRNTVQVDVIPNVDPDNPPSSYPDKRPMYVFGINLDNGDTGFSDYPDD
jgi:hypothetical protein